MTRISHRVRDLRFTEVIALAAVTLGVVAYVAPHQVPVLIYKVAQVTGFALIGFRIDRMVFPYARPDQVSAEQAPMAGMRRAVVIAAAILGGSIGV